MTKHKWNQIFSEETLKAVYARPNLTNPDNWALWKEVQLNLIKEMDKATEVYNMEKEE